VKPSAGDLPSVPEQLEGKKLQSMPDLYILLMDFSMYLARCGTYSSNKKFREEQITCFL
jgi:hypothetical protein